MARGIWRDNMWSLDRRVFTTLTLIAFAGLGPIAWVDARGEDSRDRHEHRAAEGQRQSARREAAARQARHTYPARTQSVHATAHPGASHAEHPAVNDQRQTVGSGINEWHPAADRMAAQSHFAGGGQAHAISPGFAAGQVHVTRYGNSLSGTVEHTIRPGLTVRTFVGGGHVLYTHVYQRHVWYQFGRAFAYETFVPRMRYPAVYYAWALAAWPRPVAYSWGWRAQPWYPVYGSLFVPYPAYTSPDLWMTDYIIAQSMQTAYQAQTAAPAAEPLPQGALAAPTSDSSVTAPPTGAGDVLSAPQPSDTPPAVQPDDAPAAPVARPPAITPQVKAQLDAEVKVQLQEQRAAAATPVSLTAQSTPPALRPNHVFFQVVEPLDVPTANGHCSLSADDYIKRTGGMSNDDWKIPVVVELSRPSDCPEGLVTRIGLNDLNVMENEQEAQVMQAMQAASKSMGPNGPPSGPGAHPTLIADGSAAPDPGALEAIRQAQ